MGATALLCGCGGPRGTVGVARTPRPHSRKPPTQQQLVGYARDAAAFIEANQIETDAGLTWRKSPAEPEPTMDLYHGSPGVVLFLGELAHATGEARYLEQASRGLSHLVAEAPGAYPEYGFGLYGGAAGYAAVALALHQTSGEPSHRAAAGTFVDAVVGHVNDTEDDDALLGGVTDVMYGSAGAIVLLLRAAQRLERPELVDVARRLGRGLVKRAEPAQGDGVRWRMRPADTYYMPNFSHGTAGIAFSLARLFEETADEALLDAAYKANRHLEAIANTDHDGFRIRHVDPDAPQRHYLAWCHGPPGVARLYHALHRATGDARWHERVLACGRAVMSSGIPDERTGGFWDNVSQCCGSAAVAEFYLSLSDITGDAAWEGLAYTMLADVIDHASRYPGGGLEWIHAENRIEPFWRQSYTGYMQGAAGIGSLFLRVAGRASGEQWKQRLPDDPFPDR